MQPFNDVTMQRGSQSHSTPRQRPHVPGLVRSPEDRAHLAPRSEEPPPVQHAVLWEENPDLTTLLRAICLLAGIDLTVVATLAALLAAVAVAPTRTVLLLDCSWSLPTAVRRCAGVGIHTILPIYVIHPRPNIVEALQGVACGPLHWLAPDLTGLALLEQLRLLVVTDTPPPTRHLTPREEEVLALVREDLTNAQIAHRLVMSESTAKTHIANILGKLGLNTRRELVLATRPSAGD